MRFQRIAHVFRLNFILVVFSIHPDIHRVGKIAVGAIFFLKHDIVDFVIGLKHHFSAKAAQQTLELHAHG